MQPASHSSDQRKQRTVHCQGECMSKDRGRRRTVRSTQNGAAARSRYHVRLAQGVHVDAGAAPNGAVVLICAAGNVQLNSGAAAILRLCDGSRDRNGIVSELTRDSHRHALAAEIHEFLDAAMASGWIVHA
jgi:pyrroloquinoline quinone biosynthesis protein D